MRMHEKSAADIRRGLKNMPCLSHCHRLWGTVEGTASFLFIYLIREYLISWVLLHVGVYVNLALRD